MTAWRAVRAWLWASSPLPFLFGPVRSAHRDYLAAVIEETAATNAVTAMLQEEASVLDELTRLLDERADSERLHTLEGQRAVLYAEKALAADYRLDCKRRADEARERLESLYPRAFA